jgi:hypothetical protein
VSVIVVIGGKHSPGATTLALALSSVWTTPGCPIVVEADPAGGDVAARAGMSTEPGLLTLAAAGRHGLSDELLANHLQSLPSGSRALVAPTSSEQTSTALRELARPLSWVLASRVGVSMIDLGRWDTQCCATEFLHAAAAILLVFRPTVEGIAHARTRLIALRSFRSCLIGVVVGERPYRVSEIAAALRDFEVHGVAFDPRAAAAIASGGRADGWLQRSPLVRSSAALCRRLSPRRRVAEVAS